MSIQIGRVMQSEANYREFLSGVPSMYAVDGLPAGQKASIALFGNSWKILRIIDGVPGSWAGHFNSPQEAVSALVSELTGESQPSHSDGPQPHDGIAKQAANGQWSVYRVASNGELEFLEGPFDKRDAVERLRALCPVSEGNQWVIDVWGIGTALN